MDFDRKEYYKKYYLENKEKLNEYKKKYNLENKEKLKQINKKNWLENKEKLKQVNKKYWLENKEKIILKRKEAKEKLINKKIYLELYDRDIVDFENKIYLTDGLYLTETGNIIDEKK